ncbi:hypothetical protein [Nonomuraea sp. NPDC050786]|uniref:hypothetical protein n=1 Tax=Nonomuraea sp. NPDC050786 TaxID=3154840 RepID=UPI0033F88162
MGTFSGTLALFATLVSFMPTNDDWDPEMREYSDRAAFTACCLLLAGDLYQFVTLVPHFTG